MPRQRRHERIEGVGAAAEPVHADDGIAFAFFLDDDPIEHVQRHGVGSHSKRFSIAPMPSISIFTTSPATSHFGGLKPMPTPDGVPVAMTSPG